ncbi:MAG: MATE family efflux transporter [Halalkalicoccus sp.]
MLDVSREEITEGSLPRALVVLAAPLVAQNLVQVLQQVIDTFWLGRLGEDAVAAVGLNFPIIAVLVALATVAPFVGTQVLVSQRYGADDPVGARSAAVHGTVLSIVFGIVVGALVYLLAPGIVAPFGAGLTVTELAALYLAIYALGLPIMSASDALEGGFVGWGDTRAALYINVLAVAVNVVLDPFLIFGWGPFPALGVEGAALATVIGYTLGFLLAVGMAFGSRESLPLGRRDLRIERGEFRELLDIGAPSAGQHLAQQSVRVVIIGIVASVGGAAGLAAYTVGARIASVAFIPASGLQQAAQSVIGQNIGADKPERARRATWTGVAIAGGALAVVGAIQLAIPGLLTRLFVPDITPEGFALTVEYLVILSYGYWAIGASYLLLAGFNAARRTCTSMIASLLQYWAVRLPIAAGGALLLGFGVSAVFWAVTISNVVAAVGLALYYRHETAGGMMERATEATAAD